MNLVVYLYAKDEKEAITIVDDNIKILNLTDYIKINRKNVEKYWKFEEMFDVNMNISLKNKYISILKFEKFLNSICSKWTSNTWKLTGNKTYVEEILISKNSAIFKKINNNIELIVINFDCEYNEFEDNKELILIEDYKN